MAVAAAFLAINLLATGLMTLLHYKRILYAAEDQERWKKEYDEGMRYWPYTKNIEYLGFLLRVVKVLAPFTAAFLFVLSLFLK